MELIEPHEGLTGIEAWWFAPELLPAAGGIDPRQYFITSGDVIAKLAYLLKQLEALAEASPADREDALHAADVVAETIARFVALRGAATFLETEWVSHRLVVMAKWSRDRMATRSALLGASSRRKAELKRLRDRERAPGR